jgi:beta-alanine--pyruvate transaminase
VFLRCFERGLLIRTAGDVIELSPPLIITKDEIDRLFGMLAEVLKAAA